MSTYPNIPPFMSNPTEWLRRAVPVLQGLQQGKLNISGRFTLTEDTTTTTLTFSKGILSNSSIIIWTPTTENAAKEIDGMWVSNKDVANKQLTITHKNNTSTDKTFDYVIIG